MRKINILLVGCLFGIIGVISLIVSLAANAKPQVEFTFSDNASHTNMPVGEVIQPKAYITNAVTQKTTVVTTVYYPSKYLRFTQVNCGNTICKSVSWPSFENDLPPGTFMPKNGPNGDTHAGSIKDLGYDKMFSICTEQPELAIQGDTFLFSPSFVIVDNSKRFTISLIARQYSDATCNDSLAQSSNWYRVENGSWYQCYNQSGSDGPYYDGVSRNSCYEPGQTLPGGNDIVPITGGIAPANNSDSLGQAGAGTGTGSSGALAQQPATSKGANSSSQKQPIANNFAAAENPVDAKSAQGKEISKRENQPSPFYDGIAYDREAVDVDKVENISSQEKVQAHFIYAGILIAICSILFVLKRKYDQKSS